ncbi:STAS domain-containing protein [Phototrophicus methaneseepsis]|uniref:STAS domain-containing protein n=1 Tax=Phototrophicus methaneseepsis TaxID=2710758 RepID=A0A7S8EDX9_9CHLR|nr:STAS domain-containing protein [Phototrophicus methaneseepsis]QPC84953.1 STAS domain-containing protein [Phototrophicus methaneseepsis]
MMEVHIREYVVRIHILEIVGRLEAFTVGSLREEQTRLLASGERNFIVDLSQTAFIDSAGMSALVSLLKQARNAEGDVVLVKPTDPAAYRILTLTRFDQVFVMADTLQEAIRQF